jgi:hypothetical protein
MKMEHEYVTDKEKLKKVKKKKKKGTPQVTKIRGLSRSWPQSLAKGGL